MIGTPLGEDVVVLAGINGTEEISGLFSFQLRLLSERDDIKPDEIVSKNVTVSLMDMDDQPVFLNGYIRSWTNLGSGDRGTNYHAEMVPWTWFLTRRSDCRIFQDKTIPQVITEVFQVLGFTDFDFSGLKSTYKPRTYVVQYRETDFDFVSRLLENEGIFYYFKHEEGKHVMAFGDSSRAYKPAKHAKVRFSGSLAFRELDDDLTMWEHRYEFRTGRVGSHDFNFETPQRPVEGKEKTVLKLPGTDKYEFFDYPGDHLDPAAARERARVRMEEEEAAHERIRGEGRCRSFSPGHTFTMEDHYQEHERGKSYVITSVQHSATAGAYVTGPSSPDEYRNAFECLPATVNFRPQRNTERAVVQGPQTATVVGPEGEEIYTDKHARVKVQFHWDRYHKADETSSCWVRVSQAWAGKGWGSLVFPRIGQEVIVDFLEGDPDQPIIVGRVYNTENPPPYAPETYKNMTSLKSCSTKGGDGFNELRFDDSKGQEQVFIHAEKNQDTRVKNDAFEWMGRDRHLIVKQNQLEQVEQDRHTTIKRDDLMKVERDQHLTITGKQAVKITQSKSLTVTGDVIEVFQANQSTQITGNLYIKAMQTVIEATGGLTIKCGGNSVVIDPSGVTIKGVMVTLDGAITKINSGPGSPAMSGQAGSAVSPTAPTAPEEADNADPGEVSKIRAEQQQIQAGKYGSTPARQFAPPKPGDPKKTSWIEVQLVDEANAPVAGERCLLRLPDGSEYPGTLDSEGVLRVEGIDPGSCQISFPNLDAESWQRA